MKILITGICGFVGNTIARSLLDRMDGIKITGIDNLVRAGSEINRGSLKKHAVSMVHGDIRNASDLACLPRCDWVIDAAATPTVMAGVDGKTSSRQLIEHNLIGTVNLLELCKSWCAGFTLLSTSRVYSIEALSALKMKTKGNAYVPGATSLRVPGMSITGITEEFSTRPPISLYGASKAASELLTLEYGTAFNFPVFINRSGVMAGAGQFGRIDQGVFSFWIHSYCQQRPLKFIGFDGMGRQVRDCMHPSDLAAVIARQVKKPGTTPRLLNISGGAANSMSLAQLNDWCMERFGPHDVGSQPETRPFDIPWLILNCDLARKTWSWTPQISIGQVLDEIADHAEKNPGWLNLSKESCLFSTFPA